MKHVFHSKNFDTIDHNILLQKLHFLGVGVVANNWFTIYLSKRMRHILLPTYIGKTKNIWQLWLGSIFQEIQQFIKMYLPATHVIILPLRSFIFCHMVAMILIMKQKRLCTSRKKNLF